MIGRATESEENPFEAIFDQNQTKIGVALPSDVAQFLADGSRDVFLAPDWPLWQFLVYANKYLLNGTDTTGEFHKKDSGSRAYSRGEKVIEIAGGDPRTALRVEEMVFSATTCYYFRVI